MSINLVKGQNINLSKEAASMKVAGLGLGWDVSSSGSAFDLDALAFLVGADGKKVDQEDEHNIVYFNNLKSPNGAVSHSGDNLTGEGDGDDEVITVNLAQVPDTVQKIELAICIYKAEERKQNFGQVSNAFVRVFDKDTKEEVAKYNLTEDYSGNISVVVGELYRHEGDWKFKALGQGLDKDLGSLVNSYL